MFNGWVEREKMGGRLVLIDISSRVRGSGSKGDRHFLDISLHYTKFRLVERRPDLGRD